MTTRLWQDPNETQGRRWVWTCSCGQRGAAATREGAERAQAGHVASRGCGG